MIINILQKIFGTRNERVLKKLGKGVAAINLLEPDMQSLSNEELKKKTQGFRERLKKGENLEMLLPEAFAVVREASIRTLGLRHFDVQLIGGMVLHEGKIAEMRTGEGKTLVATLAAYLNALTGETVHIVTVNDYLARRDAAWMGPIYDFLGLTVGVITANQSHEDKREAYTRDIVYGTNNEFGFDYLRDNMTFNLEDKVQRGLYFAVIDEVDSILIDEARTPLIISGPSEDSSDLYVKVNNLIPYLKKQEKVEKLGDPPLKPEEIGDYTLDEKVRQVYLTESGHQHVENLCVQLGLVKTGASLYDAKNVKMMHHINAALRAHTLFHRDIDYIVKNGEVIIVDEHTGRTMEGRRWSDGLHQAVEAKEGVQIRNENQTLASITFQNYFRLYEKISGMTGTADTEAYEFQQIYGLEVVVIPTHMPMIRKDLPDQIYLTAKEKFNAVLQDIKKRSEAGQPILVGTASIETSEKLSQLLEKEKIPHQVLNAKHHEREAKIIAQAGRPGAVTIATNMAGRGTDIVLGGSLDVELSSLENPPIDEIARIKSAWQERHNQVIAAGGLHVIGSERHESRRIDNQLRGRSGRQGDPGSSRFYLSLEDNLLRIFASDRIAAIMKKLGMQEDEVIEHSLVTRAVENAQRKVEGHNFDLRKHLLDFDNVANEQRKVIYKQRDDLMTAQDISETIEIMRGDVISTIIDAFVPPQSLEEQWGIIGLERQLHQNFGVSLQIKEWLAEDSSLHEESLRSKILDELTQIYRQKESQINPEVMRNIERSIMLQTLDTHWKDHLTAMDHLRDSIHLRGYAQQNPKQEYKRESFNMFTKMLEDIKRDVIHTLYTIQIRTQEDMIEVEEERKRLAEEEQQKMHFVHATSAPLSGNGALHESKTESNVPYVREIPKVGRNDVCPCGSGRKFKHCHGKLN
ncbi:MAG: preprotein translocase subunit SecA [Coxiellaceae bacterium]|jgi:preprotein translocase subunit SecA|nr:preprotein translocase subunit SecA [Coxiellaceae bacterium]